MVQTAYFASFEDVGRWRRRYWSLRQGVRRAGNRQEERTEAVLLPLGYRGTSCEVPRS